MSIVEAKITKVIVQMHDTVVKILTENNIMRDNSKDKMEIIIREVLKLQDTFVILNKSS